MKEKWKILHSLPFISHLRTRSYSGEIHPALAADLGRDGAQLWREGPESTGRVLFQAFCESCRYLSSPMKAATYWAEIADFLSFCPYYVPFVNCCLLHFNCLQVCPPLPNGSLVFLLRLLLVRSFWFWEACNVTHSAGCALLKR